MTHVSETGAAGYDGDLVEWGGVLGEEGHQCVARLVVGRAAVRVLVRDLGLLRWP